MNEKRNAASRVMDALRLEPRILGFYERFEQAVAHILSVVISVIIAISLWQLIRAVGVLLVWKALNPLDHAVFQTVFGMIMTLLIAMEFKHSIIHVMLRRDHIVQVKTVLLIALLAIARKFIILIRTPIHTELVRWPSHFWQWVGSIGSCVSAMIRLKRNAYRNDIDCRRSHSGAPARLDRKGCAEPRHLLARP